MNIKCTLIENVKAERHQDNCVCRKQTMSSSIDGASSLVPAANVLLNINSLKFVLTSIVKAETH